MSTITSHIIIDLRRKNSARFLNGTPHVGASRVYLESGCTTTSVLVRNIACPIARAQSTHRFKA
jgi:hypothetical protein